ncbi:MAG: ATP-binding protein [Phycisphaerales bacterium]|nr:ATP-binding protein [Phycisphaerales bacterium]
MRSEPYIQDQTLKDLKTDLEKVQKAVAGALLNCKYTEYAQFSVRLCLEEAIVNAFRHGNRSEPGKVVKFVCKIDHESAEFTIQDEGQGFDPEGVPDPTAEENLEIPSGRGLMLMRAYMSEVAHVPPGNMLRLVYKNGPDPAD